MSGLVQAFSSWVIPALLLLVPGVALLRGVRVYEVFCEGAREGLETAFRILPYLVAMFVAVGVFRASHGLDAVLGLLRPAAERLGLPAEVLPLAILRPLSGSGSLGVLAELLKEHGPDSLVGLIASTMQGSTETTFYVLTVYFGAVGVVKARHSVAVGLLGDLAGFIASVAAVRWLLG
ncbi:MAG: spore maturation protein [Firmicutes bacterium]|nr:spore maturation protein [Bacillota bacterium]MBO2522026.1 spore maturation protein [Bacillota bacterium]